MKKIKFLGTAILAASLLFAGCSSPVEDVVTEEDTSVSLSPEETGSNSGTTTGGTTTGGSTTGGTSNGGSTGGSGSSGSGGSTTNPPATTGLSITFSRANNSVTSANDVYTITLVDANGTAEWNNQIFIRNPNADAGVSAGDLVKAKIKVTSDKEISEFFFKNQYNGGNYTGDATSINLPADTETVVQVVGVVTNDYDASSSYVIDARGHDANTTLIIKEIESEILTDYEITSVSLASTRTSISSGENTTITLKDQYGIVIPSAEYEVISGTSTLNGNVLTAGNTAETVVVRATYGTFEETISITVTTERNYALYWSPTINTEGDNAPNDYFSIWSDHNWCGSTVSLSDMSATATGATLTQTVSGSCWHGTQIWYGLSQASNLSFEVTATVAGDISVDIGEGNQVYTLEAGVAKEFSFENVTGKLAIRLGNESTRSQLGDCTFTISDFSVTPASAAE